MEGHHNTREKQPLNAPSTVRPLARDPGDDDKSIKPRLRAVRVDRRLGDGLAVDLAS